MKRNKFYLVPLLFLVPSLFGCAPSASSGSSALSSSNDSSTPSSSNESSALSSSNESSIPASSKESSQSSSQEQPLTYKLTIIDPNDFIFDKKTDEESYYEAGEEIKIHSYPIMDADLAMYVDGVFSCIQTDVETDEGYCWEYKFVMPSKDVTLEFRIQGGGPIPSSAL